MTITTLAREAVQSSAGLRVKARRVHEFGPLEAMFRGIEHKQGNIARTPKGVHR